jgi:tRNA threonylcarbamoyladenosine biosynthesis protein TsaB
LAAIDTATDQAGLALFNGEQLIERAWPGGRQQTTTVLPALDALLAEHQLDVGHIGAIAVTSGPGSFTGLRVGLSLAKGLAITGGRALIGISTLDLLAAPWREAGVECMVLVPAGRGRVVWARYAGDITAPAPVNASFDDFLCQLRRHPNAIVVGELAAGQLARVRSGHRRIASIQYRRPGQLASLGYDRWRAGHVDDPTTLEPLYLHGLPNPR